MSTNEENCGDFCVDYSGGCGGAGSSRNYIIMLSLFMAAVILCGLTTMTAAVRRRQRQEEDMLAILGSCLADDYSFENDSERLNALGNQHFADSLSKLGSKLKMKTQLLDSEQDSTKTLVTDISHQLKTPISAMKTCFDRLGLQNNCITRMFIDVEKGSFDDVKAALQEISESDDLFDLFSRDEEMNVGEMSVSLVKYPMYAVLILIAVIGFMNLINTMITSIITRKRELGMLQAVGLSDKQMSRMLAGEGMVFTAFTLIASITVGNLLGYLIFLKGRDSGFMSVTQYHRQNKRQ